MEGDGAAPDAARAETDDGAARAGVPPADPAGEPLDGPNQTKPAESHTTTRPDGRVRLRVEREGVAAEPPLSVPGLLTRTVARFPDVTAIAYKRPDGEWERVTYRQYQRRIFTCAKAFLKLGLERHRSVAILGFNSPEWFVSDFAAIHAGGIAVGVYTTNSAEACHHVLSDSRANIVVAQDAKQMDKIRQIWPRLPDLKVAIQWEGEPEEPSDGILTWKRAMEIGIAEDDAALRRALSTVAVNECCTLVYTSGTVGQPKGTMLSHDNLVWEAHSITERADLVPGDETLVSFLPLSHVAAQMVDIYMSTMNGISVYFADRDALKGSLFDTIQDVQPTRFIAVPRVWEKLHDRMVALGEAGGPVKRRIADWAKRKSVECHMARINGRPGYESYGFMLARWLVLRRVRAALGFTKCRMFVTAAAPLAADVKKYFMSVDMPIMDVFGMSETSGAHTLSLPDEYRLESIGRPVFGVETKFDNPDPRTGDGELCMRGRHVFMGYLGEEGKTAEAVDADGYLRSGDVGRQDADGYLYITGRIKELLITAGGENVAPVPIEQQLKAELSFVSNAMVVGDRRKFLSVLLTFKSEVDADTGAPLDGLAGDSLRWLERIGASALTVSEIMRAKDEKIWKAINDGIKRTNAQAISNAQKIQKFSILPMDFSIPTGELGPTMKIKRSVVAEKYAEIIEKMYDV